MSAHSGAEYTLSDGALTPGVIDADAKSVPFVKSPGTEGCEVVASVGTGISNGEVKAVVVVGTGVDDLDWIGDMYRGRSVNEGLFRYVPE